MAWNSHELRSAKTIPAGDEERHSPFCHSRRQRHRTRRRHPVVGRFAIAASARSCQTIGVSASVHDTEQAPLIATAGWAVPKDLRARCPDTGTLLQRYAALLGATEINSTFYRRHRVSTFERWRESVPDTFRFAVKLPRSITHESALAAPRQELDSFFQDVRGLGYKLGPVLVQLPASVPFETRRVTHFFRLLRERHAGLVACEPRHASWYHERVTELFLEHDVARVLADPPRPPQAATLLEGTSLAYVRWHGSPRIYWSAYGDEQLSTLASIVRARAARTVWCVFDNTAAGAALHDALRFRDLSSALRSRAFKSTLGRETGENG